MSNILRTSIITASAFSLGAILVMLILENSNQNTLEDTGVSVNNIPPSSPVANPMQLDQKNKIDELITSLNITREEVAHIGAQQQKILKQQSKIEENEHQRQYNVSMESIVSEALNNSEPVISDAEFQVELEQRYAMYDSLYQFGEDDDLRTAIRVQDAFQVMQANDGIEVGTADCRESICRMQTIATDSNAANEFVNRFPEILPWGTQAAYFITIQSDRSAQITHFFAPEGMPLPEY